MKSQLSQLKPAFISVSLLVLTMVCSALQAQQTQITGKVTDAQTGDPIPFANVVFQGTTTGTTTDFDGNYTLTSNSPSDSISISYIGYVSKVKPVAKGQVQVIHFQLAEDVVNLQEIEILAGENPAFAIMRNVVQQRKTNDKRSLDAYEYESYNKIEFDVDNITDKFRERKLIKKITAVLDSIERIAGEDGKPILPIFISESLSRYYYRRNPILIKEKINKTKITGIGIEDGSLVSQLIGSSFQEYNFYQNWLNIVSKDFVSPIADGWKGFYEYDLTDSLYIGDHFCYRIDLFPKREQDLAFHGTIWIDKATWALKQIDVYIDKKANLNYIEKIKIQQELAPTEAGPWLPVKTRVLVDVGELTNKSAGMLAKFYTSNKGFVVNQAKDPRFYEQSIEVAPDARMEEVGFWNEHRHDPLTPTEVNVYAMIDTLRNLPTIKTLTEVVKIVAFGYITVGKIDLGPYPLTYANNDVEGNRFRFGFRTNASLSKKWQFRGYLAYGTEDRRYKYGADLDLILNREPWTSVSFRRRQDVEQLGLTSEFLPEFAAVEAFIRNRTHVSPYLAVENRIAVQRQLFRGFQQRIEVRHKEYDPLFPFAFRQQPNTENDSLLGRRFTTTELTIDTRYGRDELFVIDDNERRSLGSVTWPIFNLRYTIGFDGVLGGDFDYHHVTFDVAQRLKLGFLGTSRYQLTVSRIFGTVPYLRLFSPIGNESPFYVGLAYNTMSLGEFVTDQYIALRYRHSFEGFILNRIPLMRKLKWRLVGNANLIWGGLDQENRDLIPSVDAQGMPIAPINSFDTNTPYIELGYGIENIFKIFRVDAFHRITYLDNPNANKFALKFSFQLIL